MLGKVCQSIGYVDILGKYSIQNLQSETCYESEI